MQDRFEDLRTFVMIAQARQLSEAADRLGVVRSAVSRRLQELEQRLYPVPHSMIDAARRRILSSSGETDTPPLRR